jgi:hypothetical protein
MFYGLMSGLRPSENTVQEITPDEAVRVSSEIINISRPNTTATLDDHISISSFIPKYDDPRFATLYAVQEDH